MADSPNSEGAPPRLLDTKAALEAFRERGVDLGRTTLYHLRQRGQIAVVKIGGSCFVTEDEIDRVIRESVERAERERVARAARSQVRGVAA